MKKFLDYASKRYYEGNPIITDQEFDSLCESTGYVSVGYDQVDVRDTVAHPHRLYSLQKIYKGESSAPISGDIVETPKLDGAAVNLIYVFGTLRTLLTRGDGIRGQDISHLIPGLDVPKKLYNKSLCGPVQQIIGEIVAPKEIPNSRNHASGALGLNSASDFKKKQVTFVAYGAYPYLSNSYNGDIGILQEEGILTVCDIHHDLDRFPQDGRVFRLNNNKQFEVSGYTAQHPKGAYALKTRKAGVVTKLLDVVWQVGKSGAVSPVGILEPIQIDGATVSRASLHNIKEIERLNLEIGCDVEVVRAGEIIPQVIKRV